MARGQILTIPNQSAALITTLSKEQKASLSMLNPNDGVCYVKLNGPASQNVAAWDWKIPSQSYCQLPGPWESLGVYYLDQSGSGRTAEVNVYELDSQISVPSFIAIGRAVQAAGTTMDISQGGQPSNPPASTVRLWVDGSGNLNKIDSAGNNEIILDNTNYGTYVTLAGDVSGLVGANVINNNAVTSAKIANGAITSAKINPNVLDLRPQGFYVSDIHTDRGDNTGVIFLGNVGNHYVYWDTTYYQLPAGPLHVGGNILADGIISASPGGTLVGSPGDVNASRNATQGYLWFGGNGQHYLGFDGSTYQLISSALLNVGGGITSGGDMCSGSGYFYIGTGGNQVKMSWWNSKQLRNWGDFLNDGHFAFSAAARQLQWNNGYAITDISGGLQITSGGQIASANHVVPGGSMGLDQGRSTVEVSTYTHTYLAGSAYIVLDCSATSYATRSALKYKGNVNAIDSDECLKLVLDPQVEPVRYKSVNTNIHAEFAEANRPPDSSYPNPDRIGFIAEQLDLVVPEAVCYSTDDDTPDGISYAELTAILWGAVRNLNARIEQLEQPKIAA